MEFKENNPILARKAEAAPEAAPLKASVTPRPYLGADGQRALRGHILRERPVTKFN
jgi:hypothetical protein